MKIMNERFKTRARVSKYAALAAACICCAFMMTSCAQSDPAELYIVTDAFDYQQFMYIPEDDNCMVIGISGKTVHLFSDCQHANRISDKNKRFMESNAENLQKLTDNGYKICSLCEKRYYDSLSDAT